MLKLYDLNISPNALKVRAVLYELELPFETVPVNIMGGAGQQMDYLAKNPNGKVPVLEDGDFVLWESNAIIKYLASLRPDKHLLPSEPRPVARLDQWLFWQVAHYYQPVVNLAVEKIFKPMAGQAPDPSLVATLTQDFMRLTSILEMGLTDRDYLLGKLSVADFAMAANLFMRGQLGLDISAFPAVQAWLVRVESRESWQKASALASIQL
ncbi:MAG: glutathione S-transferase family protein [Candidatus Sericytochromatia bacterium]